MRGLDFALKKNENPYEAIIHSRETIWIWEKLSVYELDQKFDIWVCVRIP